LPRTASRATVNNFVGGLVSDYHELNNPPNTTVDEDNCDLDRKGSRRRRLGIDFESGYQPSSNRFQNSLWATMYTKTFEWNSVAEDGSRNFLVVQAGSLLSFYDLNFDTLSTGELPFTVNLDDFRAPAYYTTAPYSVQVASGKGALFVVGEAINPFYIQYDPASNTISTSVLILKIRDFEQQDKTLSVTTEPSALTAQQKYDLYNQGWWAKTDCENGTSDIWRNYPVLDFYKHKNGVYPQKAKTWWLGKRPSPKFSDMVFNADAYRTTYTGTSIAPLGTFILEAFNQDRSGVSGVPGLSVVVENSRPTAVAFGSGRVFYGFKNKIYFSQVIVDDFGVAAFCYQEADPTSEKVSDLVATDGGVLQIIDSSAIMALRSYENSIFSFSSVGVWAIGGAAIGTGFSATDFSIYKVSEAGSLSSRSIISVEGTPVWWSKLGIYALTSDPAKQGYSVRNLLEKKMQFYYNDIPPLNKVRATGAYDKTKKVITWLYNSTSSDIGGSPWVGNRLLNYDTILEAFYPYTIQLAEVAFPPLVTDVFNVNDIVATEVEDTVISEDGFTVFDESDVAVTVLSQSNSNAGNTTSSLKFLTFYGPN